MDFKPRNIKSLGNTKGQITLFMILGIVILAVVGVLFAIFSSTTTSEVKEESLFIPVDTIQSYVENCMRTTTEEAILENGRTGGYFLLPEHATTELFENLPYYYDGGQDFTPTNEDYAREMGSYIDTMLDFCIDDFKPFVEHGYTITAKAPLSSVVLNPQRIRVDTTFPLIITKDVQIRELSVFSVDVPAAQLYQNVNLAKQIVQSQENDEICLTCFSNLAEENDIFVAVLPSSEDTYVFDLQNRDYSINNESYHLRFAVKYENKE